MMKLLINTARLTVLEVIQGRVFQILMIISILLVPMFGYVLSSLFLVNIGKVYMDGVMGGVHFISIVFILFITASLMARDIEQKVCYLLVVRPSNRKTYLLGRFFGFIATYMLLISTLIVVSVSMGELIFLGKNEFYVAGYTWFNLTLLIFLHSFQYISLLGFVLFIVSWATGLAEIMFFSVMGFLVSWMLPPILLMVSPYGGEEQSSSLLYYVLSTVYQVLPHLNGGTIALALTHGLEIGFADMGLYVLEHIAYAGVFLSLAIALFKRRDL